MFAQQQATVVLAQSGYFTKTIDPTKTAGGEVEGVIGVNPSGVTGGTPGWPRRDNYVYVARINGDDDAHGFVSLDLFALPFGAVVHSMLFDFEVENEEEAGTAFLNVENPGIRLCLVTTDWAAGDAGPWEQKPETDCSVTAGVTKLEERQVTQPDQQGTDQVRNVVVYRADILPMATEWGKDRANYGFSFEPTVDAPTNFQVAIRTPSGVAPEAMVGRVGYDAPEDDFESFPSDLATGSFGFAESSALGPTEPIGGAFTVAPPEPGGPVRTLPVSSPVTPWWVWSIFPLGLVGLVFLARAATAEVSVASRVGPVTRLMQRRAAGRGEGA